MSLIGGMEKQIRNSKTSNKYKMKNFRKWKMGKKDYLSSEGDEIDESRALKGDSLNFVR